jgi:hypothetical protein
MVGQGDPNGINYTKSSQIEISGQQNRNGIKRSINNTAAFNLLDEMSPRSSKNDLMPIN